MEDSLVKVAIRHILVTLAWVGLLMGHRAMAQDSAVPGQIMTGQAPVGPSGGVVPPGTTLLPPSTTAVPPGAIPNPATYPISEVPPGATAVPPGTTTAPVAESDPSVVGEHQSPIGGLFGDTPPGACGICGGGNCLPPDWAVENSIAVMALSRPNNRRLGANSLPAGPLNAGTITVTNSNGITTSNAFSQYLNDAVQTTALEVHTPGLEASPMYELDVSRFLGRDGDGRDHFLEFAFNGLGNYTALTAAPKGSIIPFFDTTPFPQAIPATPPTALYFDGSLVSPFPIYLPLNGNQAQLIAPHFSILGENYDKAFNRSDSMSTSYGATYNEWELNYRFEGHNQPDQLVLNPNGRWYRQCESGYYYSYFFGAKFMVIDESFDYLSSGSQFSAVNNGNGTFSQERCNTRIKATMGSIPPTRCWEFRRVGNSSIASAAGRLIRTAMPACS